MAFNINLDHLRVYYDRLFPFQPIFDWLSYGDPDVFWRREISFTLKDDVYIRYLSFQSAADFKELVKRDQPHKIDYGPVYTCAAKDHVTVSAAKFKPVQRELVFDVDLTDYADVQLGMTEADKDKLWARGSWGFMAAAIKVVDRAMREDFGFKHLLWVFSGRRGVHCWVCDERARFLEDKQREALVKYLSVLAKGDSLKSQVEINYPLHPAVDRAVKICRETFNGTMLADENQGLLMDEQRWERLLNLLPDDLKVFEDLKLDLRTAWKKDGEGGSSKSRWRQMEAHMKKLADKAKAQKEGDAINKALAQIVLLHCYPRLDEAVSMKRNHLLKTPFAVHPKTGKVCVPIFDVDKAEDFDPDGVPTLASLVDQLDNNQPHALLPILQRFEDEFLKPLREERERDAAKVARVAKREVAEATAASTGIW